MTRAVRSLILGVAALLAAVAGTDAPAQAAGAGVRPLAHLDATVAAWRRAHSGPATRVIVTVRHGARALVRQRLSGAGDRIVAEHPSLDAITAVVGAADLDALAASGDVVGISADHVVHPSSLLGLLGGVVTTAVKVVATVVLPGGANTAGPAVPPAVLRSTLGVANSQWTGRGVGVAIVDSGIEMSAEFQGRVTAFYDFTRGDVVAVAPYDDYGHGTHVAGTIGGSGALSAGNDYRGLAPSVRLVGLKVLDANGAGYTSDVIRAIDFAVANKAALGIDIINLSLGHPIAEPAAVDPLVQAVERATSAGIVVVAAAGNYGVNQATGRPGYAGITSPGNAPDAITVGAERTDDTVSRGDDRIPDYSSVGSELVRRLPEA